MYTLETKILWNNTIICNTPQYCHCITFYIGKDPDAGEDSWGDQLSPKGSQIILKEINPEYSLEGQRLKLKILYFGHLMQRWLTGKDPDPGKRLRARGEGDDRGWDGWMASLTQRTWVWANSGRMWRTGKPDVLQSMGSQRVGHDWVTE